MHRLPRRGLRVETRRGKLGSSLKLELDLSCLWEKIPGVNITRDSRKKKTQVAFYSGLFVILSRLGAISAADVKAKMNTAHAHGVIMESYY